MADINHLISLGIGSPASVAHLVRFGLNAGGGAPVVDERTVTELLATYVASSELLASPDTDLTATYVPAVDLIATQE